jgi:hypothetical protein
MKDNKASSIALADGQAFFVPNDSYAEHLLQYTVGSPEVSYAQLRQYTTINQFE